MSSLFLINNMIIRFISFGLNQTVFFLYFCMHCVIFILVHSLKLLEFLRIQFYCKFNIFSQHVNLKKYYYYVIIIIIIIINIIVIIIIIIIIIIIVIVIIIKTPATWNTNKVMIDWNVRINWRKQQINLCLLKINFQHFDVNSQKNKWKWGFCNTRSRKKESLSASDNTRQHPTTPDNKSQMTPVVVLVVPVALKSCDCFHRDVPKVVMITILMTMTVVMMMMMTMTVMMTMTMTTMMMMMMTMTKTMMPIPLSIQDGLVRESLLYN